MKITAKTTKDTLVKVLQTNFNAVEAVDKNVSDRIVYTVNHSKSATRKDVGDLVKEVMKLLGDKFIEPATHKPATRKVASTRSPSVEQLLHTPAVAEKPAKEEAPKVEEVKKPTEEKKTPTAKAENSVKKPAKEKKSEKKSDGATVLEQKAVQLAETFPNEIEVDGEKYVIDHSVKSIKDLLNGDYEFAFYWTKRHLRQFPYFNSWLGQPKSFPNDLDTAQLIYVSDEGKVAYCVSDATEAPYTILPGDLEEVDGIRFTNGLEYQIYKKA